MRNQIKNNVGPRKPKVILKRLRRREIEFWTSRNDVESEQKDPAKTGEGFKKAAIESVKNVLTVDITRLPNEIVNGKESTVSDESPNTSDILQENVGNVNGDTGAMLSGDNEMASQVQKRSRSSSPSMSVISVSTNTSSSTSTERFSQDRGSGLSKRSRRKQNGKPPRKIARVDEEANGKSESEPQEEDCSDTNHNNKNVEDIDDVESSSNEIHSETKEKEDSPNSKDLKENKKQHDEKGDKNVVKMEQDKNSVNNGAKDESKQPQKKERSSVRKSKELQMLMQSPILSAGRSNRVELNSRPRRPRAAPASVKQQKS